jgi:hypothetical protein
MAVREPGPLAVTKNGGFRAVSPHFRRYVYFLNTLCEVWECTTTALMRTTRLLPRIGTPTLGAAAM